MILFIPEGVARMKRGSVAFLNPRTRANMPSLLPSLDIVSEEIKIKIPFALEN